MKINWNKKYTTIAVYCCLVILFATVCVSFFFDSAVFSKIFKTFFKAIKPLLWGIALAFVLNPLMKLFENKVFVFEANSRAKRKAKRILSVILTYIILLSAIGAFVWIIAPQVWSGVGDLISKLPSYSADLSNWLKEIAEKYPLFSEPISSLSDSVMNISEFIARYASEIVALIPKILAFLMNLLSVLKNFGVGFVISIYLLLSKEQVLAQVRKLARSTLTEKKYEKTLSFGSVAKQIFSRYVTTAIIDSIFVGIFCFIAMTVFRLPYAPLISLVVGVTNIIPFFGPFIGTIPSALVLFIIKPSYAFIFVALILVIQQIDGNIVVPRIHGTATGIGPVWACIAITFTSSLLGIVGMFIGVPIFAVCYYFIKITAEDRLQRKKLPYETKDYFESLQQFEYLGRSVSSSSSFAKWKKKRQGVPEVNISGPEMPDEENESGENSTGKEP